MLLKITVMTKDLQVLFFIQVSMRQRLSFMKRMGLSYQMELFVCIASNQKYVQISVCRDIGENKR